MLLPTELPVGSTSFSAIQWLNNRDIIGCTKEIAMIFDGRPIDEISDEEIEPIFCSRYEDGKREMTVSEIRTH